MTDNPLHVVFLWHMHQPYYRDPRSGQFRLPWVRLHGTKDYLDMVEMLKEFPAIRQNFNLVPSLLEQLVDYTGRGGTDVHLEMSRKRAADLDEQERTFILENFFLANWDHMIRPFPRFYELLEKRGTNVIRSDLPRSVKYFTDQDFLDLQVFFNLCWIDPLFRSRDPLLTMLVEKGRDFTEEDKDLVLARQAEILERIIPTYRDMAASGQIELSATPFYHPILPLLCDTEIARVAMPHVHLPRHRFSHPEDAERQVAMGLQYFESVFNYRPRGMWPSEGSVSDDVLQILSRQGVQWVATDEGVLAASLGRRLRDDGGSLLDPGALYRPWSCRNVSVIFRDHALSDLIGFVYSQWDAVKAADDLVQRLLAIRSSLPADQPHLVPIILDGENAWEHFRNDGRDFLVRLYERLSSEDRLRTVTISDYIGTISRGEELTSIHPGSWINANFGIWIGHEEDNLSWDLLTETREALARFEQAHPEKDLTEAWKSVFIAEGSDWNWWYGDEHATETEEDFDELFRLNLMQVYHEMGVDVPSQLFTPVLRLDREIAPAKIIRGFIRPTIDGMLTSYYEWYQGAELDVKKSGGSMHKAQSLISSIHYGFSEDTLYVRLDSAVPFSSLDPSLSVSLVTSRPFSIRVTCPLGGTPLRAVLSEEVNGQWTPRKDIEDVAIGDIFEIGIPFADLRAAQNDEIDLFISVRRDADEVERCPWRGHITLTVPTPDFEAMMWS